MTTRAQDFRNETQQSTHRARENHSRVAIEPRFSHNDAPRADHKATHAIEEPQGDPHVLSRKSTRGGSNHVKPDAALTTAQRAKIATPSARARR